MPALDARLSGLVFVDKAHDIDSSASRAFGDVSGQQRNQRHATSEYCISRDVEACAVERV
jgi:hypothetical protein